MPRERVRKDIIYKFEELSEDAQDKALELLGDINIDYDWFDTTYEDAANIGLKIEGFDIGRGNYCKGHFTQSAEDVAKAIIENHGKDCETYKTASAYLEELNKIKAKTPDDEDIYSDDEDAEFLRSLCEDYRIMLQKDYEYLTGREAIIETIKANEYEFTEEGKLA